MARHPPPTSILDMAPYGSDNDDDDGEGSLEEPMRIRTYEEELALETRARQAVKPKKAKPKASPSPKQRREPSHRVAPHAEPTNACAEKDLEIEETMLASSQFESPEDARSHDDDDLMERPRTAFEPFPTEHESSTMSQENCTLSLEPEQQLPTATEPAPLQATLSDDHDDGAAITFESNPPSDHSPSTRDAETTTQQEEPKLEEPRLEEPRGHTDVPPINVTTSSADNEIASTELSCVNGPGPTSVQDEPPVTQAPPRRVHAIVKKPIVYYQVPPPTPNSAIVGAITSVDSVPKVVPAPRHQDSTSPPSAEPVLAASRNEPELTGSSMLVPPVAVFTTTLLDDLEHYDMEIEKVVKEIEELTLLQRQRQANKPPPVVNDVTSYVQLHQTSPTTSTPRSSPKKAGHSSPRRESPRKLAPLPESKDPLDEGDKKPEALSPSYARPTRSRVSHLDAPPESPRKLRAAVKPTARIQAPRQRKPANADDKASEGRKEASTKPDKTLPPLEPKDAARQNPLGVPAHILEDGGVYPWSKLMQQVIVPQGTDSPVVYVPIFNPAYIAELKKTSPAKPSSIQPSPTKPVRHGRRTNVKPN
ncbi:hypothetical protein SDRG_09338 [Saprolegnia diclina VS20]|uniref:Uncharacterized protein n=1 Tax=Saprolegnia diclina (strain VS20) TaxID=1156394 RepID=T0Q4N6_SAPDV|nr:hypothetical protein SDRG_09338 [Saprolegnia diclina VS20]EQC32799.1 hypothetical protein SDRG_09338 [Saprolegnia diclina VS20]|eukprot:XP_008613485.1 hypothetical protein SDRG_09338 [Saprolegnia diclina VS20]